MDREPDSIVMLTIVILSSVYFYWGLRRVKKAVGMQISDTAREADTLFREVIRNVGQVGGTHMNCYKKMWFS